MITKIVIKCNKKNSKLSFCTGTLKIWTKKTIRFDLSSGSVPFLIMVVQCGILAHGRPQGGARGDTRPPWKLKNMGAPQG